MMPLNKREIDNRPWWPELSKEDSPILPSKADYERFLKFRERIRAKTEQALNLRPGTLRMDYTHVSQKTEGVTHWPFTDNFFHYYRDTRGKSGTPRNMPPASSISTTVVTMGASSTGQARLPRKDTRNRSPEGRAHSRLYKRHQKSARGTAVEGWW
jgi:hypothetical protein